MEGYVIMTILNYILILLLFSLAPAGVMWLCRKVSVLGKLGPIMVLYALGIGVANIPFMPRAEMAVILHRVLTQ